MKYKHTYTHTSTKKCSEQRKVKTKKFKEKKTQNEMLGVEKNDEAKNKRYFIKNCFTFAVSE